jgi:hypothetical protein
MRKTEQAISLHVTFTPPEGLVCSEQKLLYHIEKFCQAFFSFFLKKA